MLDWLLNARIDLAVKNFYITPEGRIALRDDIISSQACSSRVGNPRPERKY